MRSLLLVSLILVTLLPMACMRRVYPMMEGEQVASFYLRSIETGRLYGCFSGLENPPGGAEFQVLFLPRVRDPSEYRDESIGKIIWKADYGGQPLLADELHPIERELAGDSMFLKAVSNSEVGSSLGIGDKSTTHAWAVVRLDAAEAVLVRSGYKVDRQTHLSRNQLRVHRALTDRRMESFDLDGATIHELVEELERQAAEALGDADISFSIEGNESDWSNVKHLRFHLGDLRVIDLLEVLREAYGITFRIDGNLIRLSPSVR